MNINDDTIKVPEDLIVCNFKTVKELKEYMINHFKIYKLDREQYLIQAFSIDFSNMLDDIVKKGPIEAGIDIDLIIEKAKAMIYSNIYVFNVIKLPFAPDRLRRIYNGFSSFMSISLSLILNLSYLFGMPSIKRYDNITDDDLTMIFLYFGIMFKDSTSLKVFNQMILENKTVSSILNTQEKEKLENRVFNYIKHYTNSPILPMLEKITFSGGKELNKMINRLLNTFVEYVK